MIILDGMQLPADLLWLDEWTAARVVQTVRRTLDGALVVFYGQVTGGLPITLESQADAGWLTGSQVGGPCPTGGQSGGLYTLTLRGQTWRVMFRHHEAPAFEARPLVPLANPQPGDFYLATIKLMTV